MLINGKPYACDPCIKEKGTEAIICCHTDRELKRLFACEYLDCGKVFTRNANLDAHVLSAHYITKLNFACRTCYRLFAREDVRSRHERAKHGSQRARYVCGADVEHNGYGCGKTFNRRDALQQHRRSRRATEVCMKQRLLPSPTSDDPSSTSDDVEELLVNKDMATTEKALPIGNSNMSGIRADSSAYNILGQDTVSTLENGIVVQPMKIPQSHPSPKLDASLPTSRSGLRPTLRLLDFIQASILKIQRLPPPPLRPPLSTTKKEYLRLYLGREIAGKWHLISLIVSNQNAAVFLAEPLGGCKAHSQHILAIPKPTPPEFQHAVTIEDDRYCKFILLEPSPFFRMFSGIHESGLARKIVCAILLGSLNTSCEAKLFELEARTMTVEIFTELGEALNNATGSIYCDGWIVTMLPVLLQFTELAGDEWISEHVMETVKAFIGTRILG